MKPSEEIPPPPSPSALHIRFGTTSDIMFQVKHNGSWTEIKSFKKRIKQEDGSYKTTFEEGWLTDWTQLAVRTVIRKNSSMRMWLLEASKEENRIEFQEFFVEGSFVIKESENNSKKVRGLWKNI